MEAVPSQVGHHPCASCRLNLRWNRSSQFSKLMHVEVVAGDEKPDFAGLYRLTRSSVINQV